MPRSGEKSVGHALTRAARLHRARMGQALATVGLFPGQDLLVETLAAQGEMPVGELARALGVKAPTASKALARLEAQGLVARRSLERDARLTLVTLTEAGLGKADSLADLWDMVEEEMLAEFDPKDRRRLRKLLRRASRNLSSRPEDEEELGSGDEDDI